MDGRTREAFRRELALPGWSTGSTWGYDEVFESYWADLRGPAGRRVIGPEGLLVTLSGLSAGVAREASCADGDVYVALTA